MPFKTIREYSSYPLNSELYLIGSSLAGTYTSFILKPYNIMFDFGLTDSMTVTNICFLTHQHSDHSKMLPRILSQNRSNHRKIFLPNTSVKYLLNYQISSYELNHPEIVYNDTDDFQRLMNCKYAPVTNGDIISEEELNEKNNGIHAPFQVEVLKSYHTVQCFGYGFTKIKRKLKQIYIDMKDNDKDYITKFIQLKKDKIDMREEVLEPSFVFFCDSTYQNLSEHHEWTKYPVVICECACLNETDEENNKIFSRGHTALNQILPIIRNNIDKKWILIHISVVHKDKDIIELQSKLRHEGLDITLVHDRV
jgi:ribonuclease BN (tRNA processing enzyme)